VSVAYRTIAVLILLTLCAVGADAQVVETPVAFDSANKVRTITPALVTRFALKAPAWPVEGEFVEARLFALSSGGRVLVVERASGTIERYQLSDDQTAAIRFTIDDAMSRAGSPVTDARTDVTEAPTDVISEPAKGAFVRNQMGLTWVLYGPLLAALTHDGQAGTAMYLLATGASYFVTTAISRNTTITRAQNHLATDGAFRGWGIASGLVYTAAGDGASGNTYAGAGLVGALGGAIVGFKFGRRLTDSEAQAATAVSSFAALTTAGIGGTLGVAPDDGRAIVGPMVATAILGYAIGPNYPRKAGYTVTRGDIQLLTLGAALGVMAAVTPIADGNVDQQAGFAAATAGFLGGVLITERNWVRGFDHSTSDATQVGLGAIAGGLMGGALAILSKPSDSGTLGLVTGGGILGAMAGHSLARPARAGAQRLGVAPARGLFRRTRLELNPTELALSAGRVPGRHALVTLRF
jgi:hypothetical protein